MRVAVLGVTTGLGGRLASCLLAGGDTPVGLALRDSDAVRMRAARIEPFVLDTDGSDLDGQLKRALRGADAVVLAAGTGTGPGSLGAAVTAPAAQLCAAVGDCGVRRFVMVSALLPGARDRAALGGRLGAYLAEKRAAEQVVREQDLDWCVLRPGMLTDDPPLGTVRVRPDGVPAAGDEISRGDCAEAVRTVLTQGITGVWHATTGPTPIEHAFRV
ncbi:NAD(P)-dependent oxidoreductase [Streptomyces pacificus]|uniref:NAD(P)H-binding protein n=1 Tax=Streptomyces pacificus TaxID=2705029 RepID=A0A6A0AP92_9ACTN|nr:NAD(P)-binding oxidoreductase [Streptomyces pacificus]GFH34816.1 NAD(P)H-binding protein [Streptomyces pacificus]